MNARHAVAAALSVALLGSGAAVLAPSAIPPAYAACDPGTPVDGTTAQGTQRLMARQGYSNVTIDQKGCDNVWHVIATKNGQRGRFAVEPGGRIYPEGN